jgi:ketosteroid isomerase-like protein
MTDAIHPNMSILKKLDLQNLDACKSILANDFVWHYFNPRIPDLEGDYRGVEELKKFFAELSEKSDGSFRVNVIDGRPAGDELVVTHVCNCMNLDGSSLEFDAVVVWRIIDSKIAEAWDIPAVNTVRIMQRS